MIEEPIVYIICDHCGGDEPIVPPCVDCSGEE